MKLEVVIRKLSHDDRWLQWVLLVFMFLFYGVILFNKMNVQRATVDLTFNSMLQHLMHWRFDVDPKIIGYEGFLVNGQVVSYWGITCALLRLPLLLIHRLDLDVTNFSCLIAVCLAGIVKVRTALMIRKNCDSTTDSQWAFGLMIAYIVLGGSAISYLRPTIFQEIIFWAISLATIFVYFALKGITSGQFSLTTLSCMALTAGLALLTRVSTGIGLYAALGLLLLVLMIEEFQAKRKILTGRFLIPVVILVVFIIAVGAVNYLRWGNPTTFADYSHYIEYSGAPDRWVRTQFYGLFNFSRLPFTLGYYFFPLWVLKGSDGQLLYEGTQIRLFDAVELPPSSFFLTDLLPLVFIVILVMAVWAGRKNHLRSSQNSGENALAVHPPFSGRVLTQVLALAIGLTAACLLILSALYVAYRYRMEFYPEITFLAFLGYYVTIKDPVLLARFNRHKSWMLTATVVSIVSAFASLILYIFSPFGPPQNLVRDGVGHYYLDILMRSHLMQGLHRHLLMLLTLQ